MPQYMTTPNPMFQRQKPRVPSDIREAPEQGPVSIYHPAHATPRGIMANRSLARSVRNSEFRDDMYRQKAEARGALWNSNRDQERIGLRAPSMQARMEQDYANVMEGRPSMNSVKSPINTTSQNRMVAARGLNYGSDPRYRQESPSDYSEAPQPGVSDNGQRFFGAYGSSAGFAAGKNITYPLPEGSSPRIKPRTLEVSNSPITGGLRLVGRGPSTRPSIDQEGLAVRQERATAAQEQRAASLQNRRDSRILAAQKMYGLPDSTPAVAAALGRRGPPPAEMHQQALADHAAQQEDARAHNTAVNEAMVKFVGDHADKWSKSYLDQAKSHFTGLLKPMPERPVYQQNFGRSAVAPTPQATLQQSPSPMATAQQSPQTQMSKVASAAKGIQPKNRRVTAKNTPALGRILSQWSSAE